MTAVKAMMAWSTAHGDFAGATPADLIRIEPALDQAVGFAVESDADSFTVTVNSASAPGARFAIERDGTGAVTRTCTDHGRGSCLADPDSHGNRW